MAHPYAAPAHVAEPEDQGDPAAPSGAPSVAPQPPTRRRPRYNVFGHYILMQTIGEGEFAKVKYAVDRHSGAEVAIKLIKRESIDTEAKLSKVNREIMALKSVQHPHIVQLYEIIDTERYIGIVMEYASGGELFDFILAHRFLKERDAGRLFAQLISGVDYLHRNHVVHRDLKLENLLLDSDRNLKITDFGFANQFDRANEDLMATSCGSPCYAAPELVVNDGMYVGTAVDIWSCGVILYAMLAGYLPFDDDPSNPDGDNINQLYKYILTTPLVFPDYVSALARDLLRRMLVPDPSYRCDIVAIMAHPWLQPHVHIFHELHGDQVVPESSEVNSISAGDARTGAMSVPLLQSDEVEMAKAQKRHTIQIDSGVNVMAAFEAMQNAKASDLPASADDSGLTVGGTPQRTEAIAQAAEAESLPTPLASSPQPDQDAAAGCSQQPAVVPLVPSRHSLAADSGADIPTTLESASVHSKLDPDLLQSQRSSPPPLTTTPSPHAADASESTSSKPAPIVTNVTPDESHSVATSPRRAKAHSVLFSTETLASLSQSERRPTDIPRLTTANPAKRVMDWLRRKSQAPRPERHSIGTHLYAALSGDDLPLSPPARPSMADENPKLKLHRGAVDQNSLTSLLPDEVFAQVKKVVEEMGLVVYKESDYKLKCMRPAASTGGAIGSATTTARPSEDPLPGTGRVRASADGWDGVSDGRPSMSTKPHGHRASLSYHLATMGVFHRLSMVMSSAKPSEATSDLNSPPPPPPKSLTPLNPSNIVDKPLPELPPAAAPRRKRQGTLLRLLPFGNSGHRTGISSTAEHANLVAGQRRKRGSTPIFGYTTSLFKKSSDEMQALRQRMEVTEPGARLSDSAPPTHPPSILNQRQNKSTGTVSFVTAESPTPGTMEPQLDAHLTQRVSHDSSPASSRHELEGRKSARSLGSSKDAPKSTVSTASPLRPSGTDPAHAMVPPLYGEPHVDSGGEVRLTIDICKLKNLPHLLTVRVRRQRGNIWSYKYLYNEFFGRLDVKRDVLVNSRTIPMSQQRQSTAVSGSDGDPAARRNSTYHKGATSPYTSTTRAPKRASIFHPSSLFSTTSGMGRFIGRGSTDTKGAPPLKDIFHPKNSSDQLTTPPEPPTVTSFKASVPDQNDTSLESADPAEQCVESPPPASTEDPKPSRGMLHLPQLTPWLSALTASGGSSSGQSGRSYRKKRHHSISNHSTINFVSSTRATLSPPLRSSMAPTAPLESATLGRAAPSPLASLVLPSGESPAPRRGSKSIMATDAKPPTSAKMASKGGRSRAHSASVVPSASTPLSAILNKVNPAPMHMDPSIHRV
ncbi:hypothetical protein H4R35_006260 [Dimargaris xerosporica]|nr:hypothetical protein H4R35_006260 [Dimargaris xerosporica]